MSPIHDGAPRISRAHAIETLRDSFDPIILSSIDIDIMDDSVSRGTSTLWLLTQRFYG